MVCCGRGGGGGETVITTGDGLTASKTPDGYKLDADCSTWPCGTGGGNTVVAGPGINVSTSGTETTVALDPTCKDVPDCFKPPTISPDANNSLVPRANGWYVPTPPAPVDPPEISGDAGNVLTEGTDGGWFVPTPPTADTPNLQQVTDKGNTATNGVVLKPATNAALDAWAGSDGVSQVWRDKAGTQTASMDGNGRAHVKAANTSGPVNVGDAAQPAALEELPVVLLKGTTIPDGAKPTGGGLNWADSSGTFWVMDVNGIKTKLAPSGDSGNALKRGSDGGMFVTNTAVSISQDAGNQLKEGSDKGLYVPPPPGAADLISNNANNAITTGTDGKLYAAKPADPPTRSGDANNQITTGTDGGWYVAPTAVAVSSEPGNQITEEADGLYVPAPVIPDVPFISADTPNQLGKGTDGGLLVPPTALVGRSGVTVTGTGTADDEFIASAYLSTDEGNGVKLGSDFGLYVAAPNKLVGGQGVKVSNPRAGEDQVDIVVDPAAGNRLSKSDAGLLVSDPLLAGANGIDVHDADGVTVVEPVLLPDKTNTLATSEDGLYVPNPSYGLFRVDTGKLVTVTGGAGWANINLVKFASQDVELDGDGYMVLSKPGVWELRANIAGTNVTGGTAGALTLQANLTSPDTTLWANYGGTWAALAYRYEASAVTYANFASGTVRVALQASAAAGNTNASLINTAFLVAKYMGPS